MAFVQRTYLHLLILRICIEKVLNPGKSPGRKNGMLAKALEGKAEKAGSATEALRLISQVSGVARRQILSDIDYLTASGRKKKSFNQNSQKHEQPRLLLVSGMRNLTI